MSSYVITFRSTHSAITAQSILKGSVSFQVMPVPREISASCGIAIRLISKELSKARELLLDSQLEAEEYELYELNTQSKQVVKLSASSY